MAPFKLGLYAVPFGYGPISKGVAITRRILQLADVDMVFLSHGTSLEFVAREQLRCTTIPLSSIDVDEPVANNITSDLDGMIVVMHRPWANRLAPHMPVYFVDSLGFIWNPSSFENFPGFSKVERFYAQDLFGAVETLSATGLSNLVPVPPIFSLHLSNSCQIGTHRQVFQLGGLSNPFAPEHSLPCAQMLISLAIDFNYSAPLFLTSDEIIQQSQGGFANVEIKALPHADALSCYKKAEVLFTAPGLTTLIELAHLQIPACPLPPENFSQCLNVHNLVHSFGFELPPVWHFLSSEYSSIRKGMAERDGVYEVIETNRRKFADPQFRNKYISLAKAAINERRLLPTGLCSTQNGADIVAQDILMRLQDRSIKK